MDHLLPVMKKQVTFAENHKVHTVHQNDITRRWAGMHYSKRALPSMNHINGLTIQRPPAMGHQPQFSHVKTTVHIPKSMTTAPFLKNSELTPGQKKYLYTIADVYSKEHVRSLIHQHYINVLHRCTRAGQDPERDVVLDVIPESESTHEEREKPPSKVPYRKHSGKHHRARRPTKPTLPKISSRQRGRSSITSKLKHRKSKEKHMTKMTTWRKPSPKRSSNKLLGEEEDQEAEERPDDSLSESMSLLSIGSLPMEEGDYRLLDVDDDGKAGSHSSNRFPGYQRWE